MNDKWQHTFQIDETECVVASIYKSVIHQYVITQKRETPSWRMFVLFLFLCRTPAAPSPWICYSPLGNWQTLMLRTFINLHSNVVIPHPCVRFESCDDRRCFAVGVHCITRELGKSREVQCGYLVLLGKMRLLKFCQTHESLIVGHLCSLKAMVDTHTCILQLKACWSLDSRVVESLKCDTIPLALSAPIIYSAAVQPLHLQLQPFCIFSPVCSGPSILQQYVN